MGLIKKKTAIRGSEGGVKYVCDVCSVDITATVRINCDTCPDYDLCVQCFADAKSSREHDLATHAFRVIEQHSIPIYSEDWGADEELLLLEGAETYGLGSWSDIADHIGGCRTKDEVRDHYIDTYINSSKFPLPEHASPADTTFVADISREDFQARKKRRIDERKDEIKNAPPAQPKTKPTASVPSCHEVQGFMPGRLEFETEYFNEAEEAVQHMQFDPGDGAVQLPPEQQQELDLKMVIMNIYNDRLDARVDRKKIIFEHKLLEYKTNQAKEKKRTKEERDLINRAKPFARMMRHDDYETFCNGLEYEHQLRQAIAQLQEWRSMQITELKEGATYEERKSQRAARPLGQFDRLSGHIRNALKPPLPPEASSTTSHLVSTELPLKPFASGLTTPPLSEDGAFPHNATAGAVNGTTHLSSSEKKFSLPPLPGVTPHSLAGMADLQLLTVEEKKLCENLRLQPKAYILLKETVVKEAIGNGGVLKRKTVKDLCRLDGSKGTRLFDFWHAMGLVGKA